ncbi:DUF6382 domain-containing protein [Neobacillus sp. Marseille-QA0830]
MGKTTLEKTKNKYVVVNKLNYPEAINERELNGIARGLLEGLIPVTAESSKKGLTLKTSIVGMMSLKSYFSSVMSKKMFLDMVRQLIIVVKECERHLLNVNNLVLDCEYIFLDPSTKKIKCIFWPIVNNQNPSGIAEFFQDLPFRVIFSKNDNHDYVGSYLNYFKSLTPFSINGFEKLILEMMGKTAENNSHVPSGSTGFGDDNRPVPKSEEVKADVAAIAYNPLSQAAPAPEPEGKQAVPKFCTNCGNPREEGAKFCVHCGSSFKAETALAPEPVAEEPQARKAGTQSFSETTVLGVEDYGGTTVLGADAYEEPSFPYLIREKTQEKISVNKPSFRIGKESKFCDYFISDNNAISRSHADIITKDHRYYIIDQNSTNKTYVDGRVIPVQKEAEIFSGTKLRLANEDFVFYI